ncbi:MAG: DUF2306 domain-containing protein [Gemmatimonadaceae bacterium]|nr:DUF2306 domain-containing protein [Gemmatimonadaceae bacterium]MCW5827617.1 DUF2306 domain-containing protein [Gemmatimonadaceae bacterium]
MPPAATTAAVQSPPRRRAAPPFWWLMLVLAIGVAGYAVSFTFRGIDAFGIELLASFYQRPWAIWFHMMFGAVALVTGALNFRHSLRRRRPAIHRKIGEWYVFSCLVSGTAGGWLALHAYGGLSNRLGFLGLAVSTLVTTPLAYRAARAGRFAEHRAWMIRSYAVILAAVTLRIQLPILAMSLGGFAQAYAVVAWSCWVPNLLVAEWIVRATTRRPATGTPPGSPPSQSAHPAPTSPH